LQGGFGVAVESALEQAGVAVPVRRIGLPNRFVEQGGRQDLLNQEGLSAQGLAATFREFFARGHEEGV